MPIELRSTADRHDLRDDVKLWTGCPCAHHRKRHLVGLPCREGEQGFATWCRPVPICCSPRKRDSPSGAGSFHRTAGRRPPTRFRLVFPARERGSACSTNEVLQFRSEGDLLGREVQVHGPSRPRARAKVAVADRKNEALVKSNDCSVTAWTTRHATCAGRVNEDRRRFGDPLVGALSGQRCAPRQITDDSPLHLTGDDGRMTRDSRVLSGQSAWWDDSFPRMSGPCAFPVIVCHFGRHMFRLVRAVILVEPGTDIYTKDFCRRAMNKRQRIRECAA